jgi:hypothetical protein
MTTEEYCREIEAYLCRKNDGHLIRIVGPSFERVCRWAADGIPLRIACQGIDRYFVRYYAKGARRRPVQIDFCEHDVIDAFDAWRRALGVRLPDVVDADEAPPIRPRTKSLPEHLDRVCERVIARRAAMTRARAVARLAELDRIMLDAARAQADPAVLRNVRAEAVEQLVPFRDRMPADAYLRALESAVDRLLRDHEQLPTLTFE